MGLFKSTTTPVTSHDKLSDARVALEAAASHAVDASALAEREHATHTQMAAVFAQEAVDAKARQSTADAIALAVQAAP